MPLYLRITFGMLLLFLAGSSFGQSNYTKHPDLTELSLEDLLNINVSITSTSTEEETILTAPAIVSRYQVDDLSRMGARNMMDILEFIPGVKITRTNDSRFNVSIRGIYEGINQKVLFLVDGIPYYQYSHSSFSINQIPIESISHVEVIRGPGAGIYGTNAAAGVINIVTNKKDNTKISLSRGSANMSNYGGSYVKNFSEDANLFFGFQAKDGGKFESDFNQGALSKTVGGEVDLGNKYDSFVLGGKYKNTNYLLAAYQDKNYGIAMVSDVDSNGGMDHNTILAHIDHTFKYNKADLKIYSDYNLYYLQFTAENQFNGVGQPKVAKIVKFPNKEENYRSRVGMTFDYKASKYLNLFFGHEYEHRSHGDYTMINSDSGDILGNVLPKNSIYESAFFFQGDYFYEDWRFLLGARRTENELTGDKTTPRASVIYKISEYSSLKMLYAVGFNSPNAIQQRMAFTNVVVGNPDLRSETTKTIDLAYTYSRDHLLFVGNIFQLITNDQIMRGVPESGGALTYRNEDQFMRHGFELDFQKAWSSSKLFVNFAYLHEGNQDKSDDITLEFSSKYSSSIGYLYKLNDNHSVGGTYYYRSPRSNTDLKEEVAANNLLNLNYEYTKSNYKIFATISNFFDQEIREPNHAVSSGGQILQIRPGQTIESGVKFQF